MNNESNKSTMLFLPQVPEYLYAKYGVVRCGRVIRFWADRGYSVKGKRVYLKVLKAAMGQMYTRKEWVDEFIKKVGNR